MTRGWEGLRWAGALGAWGGWRRRQVKSSPGDLAQPRWSPWVLSSAHPTLIPWTLVASISLLWSHQFSARTAHQSLYSQADPPFPPGPGFFLASPPLHCSEPFLFTASQGSECSPHGRIGGHARPGNYPRTESPIHSSLSARGRLPAASTPSARRALTMGPPGAP